METQEITIRVDPESARAYRAATPDERRKIDLLLSLPGRRKPWAIEIKRSLAPRLERGFHLASESIRPERSFVVYAGSERYALAGEVEAIALVDLCAALAAA